MRGFQLWINLPAKEKMKPAGYRDIQAPEIPVVDAARAAAACKVIAGTLDVDGRATPGPIQRLTTDPLYFDVELPAGARFTQRDCRRVQRVRLRVRGQRRASARPNAARHARHAQRGRACPTATRSRSTAGPEGGRFLLLAGTPMREPIVQYGPFVMNTREEIEQAIRDYQNGELTRAAA